MCETNLISMQLPLMIVLQGHIHMAELQIYDVWMRFYSEVFLKDSYGTLVNKNHGILQCIM